MHTHTYAWTSTAKLHTWIRVYADKAHPHPDPFVPFWVHRYEHMYVPP